MEIINKECKVVGHETPIACGVACVIHVVGAVFGHILSQF
mgnify:CR=1 FL=1